MSTFCVAAAAADDVGGNGKAFTSLAFGVSCCLATCVLGGAFDSGDFCEDDVEDVADTDTVMVDVDVIVLAIVAVGVTMAAAAPVCCEPDDDTVTMTSDAIVIVAALVVVGGILTTTTGAAGTTADGTTSPLICSNSSVFVALSAVWAVIVFVVEHFITVGLVIITLELVVAFPDVGIAVIVEEGESVAAISVADTDSVVFGEELVLPLITDEGRCGVVVVEHGAGTASFPIESTFGVDCFVLGPESNRKKEINENSSWCALTYLFA